MEREKQRDERKGSLYFSIIFGDFFIKFLSFEVTYYNVFLNRIVEC